MKKLLAFLIGLSASISMGHPGFDDDLKHIGVNSKIILTMPLNLKPNTDRIRLTDENEWTVGPYRYSGTGLLCELAYEQTKEDRQVSVRPDAERTLKVTDVYFESGANVLESFHFYTLFLSGFEGVKHIKCLKSVVDRSFNSKEEDSIISIRQLDELLNKVGARIELAEPKEI